MVMILLIILSVVLFILFSGAFYLALRAGRQLREYEYFFGDTVEDLHHAAAIFDELVNKRELLVNDPDIQKLKQVFAVSLDILVGYLDEGKRLLSRERQEKKKEKK